MGTVGPFSLSRLQGTCPRTMARVSSAYYYRVVGLTIRCSRWIVSTVFVERRHSIDRRFRLTRKYVLTGQHAGRWSQAVGWADTPGPAGLTDSWVGLCYGTVQVPCVCQPLTCAPLLAYRKIVCVPANVGVNVTASVSVSVFPLGTAVLLPNAIAHWLFCSVPLPSGADSHVAPASSIKLSVFVPGW
jgi:hypothetical protein